MADIATPEFLNELKSLYPAPANYVDGDWFLAAGVAFSSSNCPEGVPCVLHHALKDLDMLPDTSDEDRKLLVRKMRDGIFKSNLITGIPKVINALLSLYEATPEALRDIEPLRDSNQSNEEVAAAGVACVSSTYGDTTTKVRSMIRSICADLEHFTMNTYGYVCAFFEVTSAKETSFAMISALIANDTPRQAEWHLAGAIRNGATYEETRAVREIALRIAMKTGVLLKHNVPNI